VQDQDLGPVAASCKHGIEFSGSIKCWEISTLRGFYVARLTRVDTTHYAPTTVICSFPHHETFTEFAYFEQLNLTQSGTIHRSVKWPLFYSIPSCVLLVHVPSALYFLSQSTSYNIRRNSALSFWMFLLFFAESSYYCYCYCYCCRRDISGVPATAKEANAYKVLNNLVIALRRVLFFFNLYLFI
jgi:hypothetical protein